MRLSRDWLLLLLCAGLAGMQAVATATEDDGWAGQYRLAWVPGTAAARDGAPDDAVSLMRAPAADPARLVEKYRGDLARWTLGRAASSASTGDRVTLRRFLAEEYAEFGWRDMHALGGIQCLDGGHLFLCRVAPDSTVAFGPDGPRQGKLQARTGLFGIRLHAGAFELTKLDSTP